MVNEYKEKFSAETFLVGDGIDLMVPTQQDLYYWTGWFNNSGMTRYMDQGVYPNYLEDQKELFDSVRKDKTRLVLLNKPKDLINPIGLASLSNVNFIKRTAVISLAIGDPQPGHDLYALESMSLLTEHAFETMGLERISAGQVFPGLKNWNKRMELLGYKAEGVSMSGFRKGLKVYDVVQISCLLYDYLNLKHRRDGKYWPGTPKMLELIRLLPDKGFGEILIDKIKEMQEKYYGELKI